MVAEGRARQPAPMPGFPELADAAVVWSLVEGPHGEPGEHEMGHAAGTWRPLLPCANPACHGGGFDLGSVVEGMISFREAEKGGILVCEGWEGDAPPEAGGGIPCVHAIRYRLRLTYRTAASPLPAGPAGPAASAGSRGEGG